MKSNTKRTILSAAGLVLSASNALAKDMMDSAVDSLDPSMQSWAKMAVLLVKAGFCLVMGGGLFYYGATYYLEKKQGHTSQAGDARTSLWHVFGYGVLAIVLYNIFSAFAGSYMGM